MDVERLLRNWLYPLLAAAGTAAISAYQAGCIELACMKEPVLYAVIAAFCMKMNGLRGRGEKWFSHDKGDGASPHEVE